MSSGGGDLLKRRALQTSLRTLAAVVIALAVLVAAVLYTPIGVKLALALWPPSDSGLTLTVESIGGSVLRGASLTGVRLADRGGVTIVEADSLSARVGRVGLLTRTVSIDEARLSSARFLFESRERGGLVGWSDLGAGDSNASETVTDEAGDGGPGATETGGRETRGTERGKSWTIDLDLSADDLTVVVKGASGTEVMMSGLEGVASGAPDDLSASLAGSLRLALRGLDRPLSGTLDASLRYLGTSVDVQRLSLDTNAGEAEITGALALPRPDAQADVVSADLSIQSTHDLADLTALLGLEGVSGRIWSESTLEGPVAGPQYVSRIAGSGIGLRGAEFDTLSMSVKGDASEIGIESLSAEGMGGSLDAEATARMGAVHGKPPTVSGDVRLRALDVASLAALAPGPSKDVSGALSGDVAFRWDDPDLTKLEAVLDLRTAGLRWSGHELGELAAVGRAGGGIVTVSGGCCGVTYEGMAYLSSDGLGRATASVTLNDLSLLGSAIGVPGLAGTGTAELDYDAAGDVPTVKFAGRFPELAVAGLDASPASLDATGFGGRYEALFSAFGGSVAGTGVLQPGGEYEARVTVKRFDLASMIPDSLRESMSFSGALSVSAVVTGGPRGRFGARGEVTQLTLAARGQDADLSSPFSFEASRDSVRISEAALEGTFGAISLSGGYTRAAALDLTAALRALDLEKTYRFLPVPPRFPPSGIVGGDVTLSGTRDAPEFSALVTVSGFSMAGLDVSTATLDVSGDSTDVVFDLTAKSGESGDVWAGGSMPVRTDSISVLAFDPTREFGLSVLSSAFTLNAGETLLPGVRGSKRFRLDGSALLTGTAGSLESINGSGLFSELSAEFDLASFALADTAFFVVDGGSVSFDKLAIDVTRKHVLGDPQGGRVTLSGMIDPNGAINVTADAEDVDVGHVVRALGGRAAADLRGRLFAEASAEGDAKDPNVTYSWRIDHPTIAGFGFESGEGSGTFGSHLLSIDRASLRAKDSVLEVNGRVAAATATPRRGPRYDLRVSTEDFRLGSLTTLSPDLSRLDGRLSTDIQMSGGADSLSLNGTASLTKGSVGVSALDEPLKDITVELTADGPSVAVTRGSAKMGGGSVAVTGGGDFSSGLSEATFFASVRLRSPEFAMKDMVEGKVAGNLNWGGTLEGSTLQGRVSLQDVVVTRSFGLADLVTRRPPVLVVKGGRDPRAHVKLDVDIEIEDALEVKSNVAELSLEGGATVVGTLLEPRVSGSVYADGGKFTYLSNDFNIETLNVGFIDPRRRDPYITLTGTADVLSRSDEPYTVTVAVDGFANEVVPRLSSVPSLSEPDIVTLLTFGDTFGAFLAGEQASSSSGDRFSALAGRAFLASAFGIAESTLERLLHLDVVAIDREQADTGDQTDTNVTLGKEFGGRLRVNYTTAVGRLSNQRLEVSFEVMKRIWLETRTDPEGDNAVGLRLRIPFK
jgi:autotransporter translocation and assembly factor TamB